MVTVLSVGYYSSESQPTTFKSGLLEFFGLLVFFGLNLNFNISLLFVYVKSCNIYSIVIFSSPDYV